MSIRREGTYSTAKKRSEEKELKYQWKTPSNLLLYYVQVVQLWYTNYISPDTNEFWVLYVLVCAFDALAKPSPNLPWFARQ